MATRTIEDVLREALGKADGNVEAALGQVQAWSNADSTIREAVERYAWELAHKYLLDLKETAAKLA